MSLRLASHAHLKRRIVVALLDYPADQYVGGLELADKIGFTNARRANHVTVAMRAALGWTETHKGRNGGIRLTPAGRIAAEHIAKCDVEWAASAIRRQIGVRDCQENPNIIICRRPECEHAGKCMALDFALARAEGIRQARQR